MTVDAVTRHAHPRAVSALPVYCIPHAAGTAEAFRPLRPVASGHGLVLRPVELSGRGQRGHLPIPTRMDQITDDVSAHLPDDVPYVLLGHSMGAIVAYETVRRLAATGRLPPILLVVSGCRPPGAPVHRLLRDGTARQRLHQLVALNWVPAAVAEHPHVGRLVLDRLEADLRVLADHRNDRRLAPVPSPILALAGAQDTVAGPTWLAGWRPFTSAGFALEVLPGGHLFCYADPESTVRRVVAAVDRLTADVPLSEPA